MSRDHYKGVPKRRNVVVRPDNLLDIEAKVRPELVDNTPIVASGIALRHTTAVKHEVIDAATLRLSGSTSPVAIEFGTLQYLKFDHDTDDAHRLVKIGSEYAHSASIHVHWTKTDDLDNSGKFSRWEVTYSVFNGNGDEVDGSQVFDTGDLEYVDSGTTTRYVYRSPNYTVSGIEPGDYVSFKISRLTPTGSGVVNPGLVALDFSYRAYINLGN